MIKFFKRLILYISIILLFLITYLSVIGIETKAFNSEIKKNLKNINKDLDTELNSVKIIINPFKLQINIKTLGPKILLKNQSIQLESIKSQIPILSLIKKEFSSTNLFISTKSIKVNDFVSFLRAYENKVQFYLLDRIIKGGYLIADINLNFDKNGLIKKDYVINGLVKEGKINLLNNQKLEKINFIFNIKDKILNFQDLSLRFGNINLLSKNILFKANNKKYFVEGKMNSEKLSLTKDDLKNSFLMLDNYFNVDEINFESSNVFSFEINKKFKIENLKIKSEIDLYNLQTKNNFDLENFFPNIEDEIKLKDQKIKIDYNNKKLLIIGRGSLITQKNPDEIEYRLEKNKDDYSFNINLDISKSEFTIKPLNFFKKENSETLININGNFFKNNLLFFDQVNIKNENNIINLKKIYFNENFELKEIQKADFDFIDIDNLRNNLSLNKKNKNYELKGKIFNVDKIIDSLIKDNDKGKSNLIRKKFKIYVNIDKVHLGSDYFVRDLKGFLEFDDSKIIGAELNSFFENDDEQLNFTIKKIDDKKVTTFFSGKAKPFVNKYDFVKGFEEGSLDFYSISSQNVSNSKLKIYDFKLKELPALTKLLTLASLQGIADLLSGEGIRFNEFEMNYENNNSLVKIDEIYAIGPAISILMEGYVERNKLISLRGTLVPATTINKAIGSIPILGDILVGKKTGEGVFGVSFKVKGTPKNLETSVNPIKTLTPRFITRTLEKIKKN